jgi:hypothetical protein
VTDELPFDYPSAPNPGAPKPRTCRRHVWATIPDGDPSQPEAATTWCLACHKRRDATASRRGRNNRKRGTSDELAVARLLGGEKVGPLGLPWDVVVEGYLRVQCKRLDRWPPLGKVVEWLDAIPEGDHLRAVTVSDTPGAGGGRIRRLIVLDLEEYARWHGK